MLTSTGHGRNQGTCGLATVKSTHLWCFFVHSGKRIISSPGRKTHCDICKQMIPENKYISHMVSSNYPLSVPGASSYSKTQGMTADSRYLLQSSHQRFWCLLFPLFVLVSSRVSSGHICIVGFHFCLAHQGAALTTPHAPGHLWPSPTFRAWTLHVALNRLSAHI